MASPLPTAKQSVDLAAAAPSPAGSRIRRDPPPVIKELVIRTRDERDTRTVVIGITIFVLALVTIVLGFSIYGGWSPRDMTIVIVE